MNDISAASKVFNYYAAISIDEVEFITIMTFDSLDAEREFAGEDYEIAVVPKQARKLLSRFDERSQHYEIVDERMGSYRENRRIIH